MNPKKNAIAFLAEQNELHPPLPEPKTYRLLPKEDDCIPDGEIWVVFPSGTDPGVAERFLDKHFGATSIIDRLTAEGFLPKESPQ